MTAIGSYGYGPLATQRADSTFRTLKAQLGDLQTQLATGKRATTYAGLGTDAIKSLSGRQTLASIQGYAENVKDAQMRLGIMSVGIEQIGKIANSLRASLPTSYESTQIGQTSAIVSAEDGLKQVLDILNTQVDGRYLFSGRSSDTQPIADYDLIVNGDGTRAGLKQIIAERQAADRGANGLGRLTMTNGAGDITVSEEAVPFGIKINGASATGTGLIGTSAPGTATLGVAAQPATGDTVSLSLRLPDGSSTTLTFTAGSATSGDQYGFAIGADATATAANLQAAVTAAVTTFASEKLPAASALGASQTFFAASTSNPPLRVAGPPYDSATATVPGTAADTVIWYQGDDAAGSARETAPVRTGAESSVAIGARANEAGFRTVLAALGAMVGQTFPPNDPAAQRRYAATTSLVADSVGDAMQPILTDFASARASLESAKNRIDIAKNQVEDTIAGVEDADPNEVAVKLLATQTRLQASYQTTSVLSKMTLVNYL